MHASVLLTVALASVSKSLTKTTLRATSTTASATMTSSAAAAAAAKTLVEVSPSYKTLVDKLKIVTQLRRASAVLDYDKMVFMPSSEGASRSRGSQIAALAEVIHEKSTDPAIAELVDAAEADLEKHASDLGAVDEERQVLRLTRRSYDKSVRVPKELEARKAALSSAAYAAWVKARSESDFSLFAPKLKECFDTAKEIAACERGDDESIPLYTQMLDTFETGMPVERIDAVFGEVKEALVPLIAKVLASEHKPSTAAREGTFDVEAQKKVNRDIVVAMGYEVENGRIDESVHPFSMPIGRSDVRITSRFQTDEWFQGIAATIHEAGHAMYEQNLGDSDLAVDDHLSMGTHESQSLFWERHVGLTKAYCEYAAPRLAEAHGPFCAGGAEELYGAINSVSPSLIRVDADELTYPLHVILRYDIEREIVSGTLEVEDVPERWNRGMKETLGVDVPDDANGCLQDIHWSMLAIGYFPTYLIGAIVAAQLAHFCERDVPSMHEKVAKGEFGDIKAWLTDKIHRHGSRYVSLDAMLKDQLGEEINPKYFIDYLTEKYTELYKL